jgi:hypothetical protein
MFTTPAVSQPSHARVYGSPRGTPRKAQRADVSPPPAVEDYDEIDRRLIDTFPASDAVARF